MRSIRVLAAVLTTLAVVACTSAPPGWTYAPAPSATPVPSVVPGDSGAAPSESAAAGGIEITALNVAFDKDELTVPAAAPFQLVFHNDDPSIQHNVAIHEGSPTGPEVFKGDIFPGVETRTYDVPAIPAGTYGFICTVHPNMTGTLTAQ